MKVKCSSIYISKTPEYYLTDYTGVNIKTIYKLLEGVEIKYDFYLEKYIRKEGLKKGKIVL